MKGKLLVVEDEAKIVDVLRLYLEQSGYRVSTAPDGVSALKLAHQDPPDLVILDLNLPDMDGLEVCRRLRSEGSVPIIMLTARVDEVDRVVGLEVGADDYVTKPFSPREVVARVSAVLRRARGLPSEEDRITVGDLNIDLARHQAQLASRALDLTPTEFRILATLARHPGRVFSRLQILEQALDESFEGYERTIDAHIKNIRKKMESPPESGQHYVQTVYGVGYKLEAPHV